MGLILLIFIKILHIYSYIFIEFIWRYIVCGYSRIYIWDRIYDIRYTRFDIQDSRWYKCFDKYCEIKLEIINKWIYYQ